MKSLNTKSFEYFLIVFAKKYYKNHSLLITLWFPTRDKAFTFKEKNFVIPRGNISQKFKQGLNFSRWNDLYCSFETTDTTPLDSGCKLNAHKKFRRCPGRLLNILHAFNLRSVFRGKLRTFILLLIPVWLDFWLQTWLNKFYHWINTFVFQLIYWQHCRTEYFLSHIFHVSLVFNIHVQLLL